VYDICALTFMKKVTQSSNFVALAVCDHCIKRLVYQTLQYLCAIRGESSKFKVVGHTFTFLKLIGYYRIISFCK